MCQTYEKNKVVGEEERKIFYAKNPQKNTFAYQYFLIEFGWALIQGLLYLSITKIKRKYHKILAFF